MKIRVLLAIDSFPGPIAGTERQLWNLINNVDRDRIDFGIMLLRDSEYLANSPLRDRVDSLNIQRLSSPRSVLKVLGATREARKNDYEIVHTFFNDCSLIFPFLAKKSGLSVVVSRRDEGFWYNRKNLTVLRANRLYVDTVVANSQAVASAVMQHEGYEKDKLRVVGNGVEPLARSRTKAEALKELRICEDTDFVVLGLVANLRPLKRVDQAIHAVAAMINEGKKVRLIVAGSDRPGQSSDSHQGELISLCNQLNVDEFVHFVGHQPDVSIVYDALDVGLSCSSTEGMSNSIMEMLAAGIPVVASKSGGTPELISHGSEGLLYDAHSVEDLVCQLRHMIDEPDSRSEMGKSARQKMQTTYSVDAMVSRYAELYEELVVNK